MAPAYAMPKMLDRATASASEDFDYYEIHEAFAAQVLCTLAALGGPVLLPGQARPGQAAGAPIDRAKLNVNGGSLAGGAPVRRDRRADRRRRSPNNCTKTAQAAASISICAAGGQGVVAILEGPGGAKIDRCADRYSQVVNAPVARPSPSRSASRSRPSWTATGPAALVVAGPVLRGARPRRPPAERGRPQQLWTRIGAERRRAPKAPGQGAGLRRDRHRRLNRPGRAAALLLPRRPAPAAVRPVVVLGTPPALSAARPRAHTAQRALEGFALARQGDRRQGRHRRSWSYVAPGAEDQLELDAALPALAALGLRLRPGASESAKGVAPTPELDWDRPLTGRIALVTGASRGIGAAIAATLGPRRRQESSASTCRRPKATTWPPVTERSAARR